jgi:autophagy-related protein 2
VEMASFFLPSSIQKRLLRYALSRLEILDTDALDLEHLDIAWGKKSVVEFRNVALQVKVRTSSCPTAMLGLI